MYPRHRKISFPTLALLRYPGRNDPTERCNIELLETGGWIAVITSLALGNIEIDQAVVSAIADMIAAANVTLGRMTPTSGSIKPAGVHWHLLSRERVNYLT